MRGVTIKTMDVSKLLAKYTNCWVALSADERRVLATARHPKQALNKAHQQGEPDPILMWAPKTHDAYVV